MMRRKYQCCCVLLTWQLVHTAFILFRPCNAWHPLSSTIPHFVPYVPRSVASSSSLVRNGSMPVVVGSVPKSRGWLLRLHSHVDENNDHDSNGINPLDIGIPSGAKGADESPVQPKKLGIDLGSMLDPLTPEEAASLKAEAAEIISDKIAEGIDEIEALRERMRRDIDLQRKASALEAAYEAQQESEKLMQKIDSLADDFLQSTKASRSATKLAAAADRSMEGRSLEWGSWGALGDAAVLLGSVDEGMQKKQLSRTTSKNGELDKTFMGIKASSDSGSGIVVIADVKSDEYARKLLPTLTEQLSSLLPNAKINVYPPTATMPLGGEGAACVLIFCTSINDPTTLRNNLDRLLRKTLQSTSDGSSGAGIVAPPTQLVAISTLGTERTNKMPYSMQNMMAGGKLDKRRQLEEVIINTVRKRLAQPSLDYTICKFGELRDLTTKDSLSLEYGDVLDGATDLSTAVTVVKQAIALQPAARNSTFSCTGKLVTSDSMQDEQYLLDDLFMKLDGPELWRFNVPDAMLDKYDELVEYLAEWAELLAATGKGLTTPVRAEISNYARTLYPIISKTVGVKLLFLPTATGKKYLSKKEEDQRQDGDPARRQAPVGVIASRGPAKDGGIEIVVEMTTKKTLRVRARRCNYASDDAVIKELSEETIVSRLKESITTWMNGQKDK